MPYVSVKTAAPVDRAKKDALQAGIGALISIIPGKTIDNCMTEITGGCSMYMGGREKNTVFCEIRLFGPAPAENKSELTGKLLKLFTDQLAAETVYINFLEFNEWGSGAGFRQL